MERDFMGLFVKQELPDEINEAAPVRSLPMQWSFSNKGSAHPQLLSFQGAQEDKQPKTGFHSLASSGLVNLNTDVFNSNPSQFPGSQKSSAAEKQGGVHYTMTTYSNQHGDAHNIRRALTTPSPAVAHPPYAAPMAGGPMAKPSNTAVVGTTDFRSSPKISNAPAQLTIFYNGSVCAYDNISPEKAQAIMLLAGNAPLVTPKAMPPAAPVQVAVPRPSAPERLTISQPYAATPHRSSPVPMTPISISPSAGQAGIRTETTAAKPSGARMSPPINAEPLKSVTPLGSASFLSPDTVPQFRRKSLARFLEKRKESRVISASPYGECQSGDYGAAGTSTKSLSVKSPGTCPVPATN
ncbi:protein TIFY 6B-like isoform X1 [Salvia hispanica]|uniref:protein TIFY 6B-like isoform X1 n=2 Tax=Salvia hispanica TaxID=49212 RepID=UPI0020094D7B|nr:protein TIFY 6B-like isoform X1 [Salvia hispanica]